MQFFLPYHSTFQHHFQFCFDFFSYEFKHTIYLSNYKRNRIFGCIGCVVALSLNFYVFIMDDITMFVHDCSANNFHSQWRRFLYQQTASNVWRWKSIISVNWKYFTNYLQWKKKKTKRFRLYNSLFAFIFKYL